MCLSRSAGVRRPVVAGRTGGVPAVVADGVAGVLTPIGDAASFAARSAVCSTIRRSARVLAANTAARIAARHDDRAAAHALAAALGTLR